MKHIFTVLLAIGSLNAFSCIDDKVCSGDKVIPDGYPSSFAKIIAINTSTRIVTVQGNHSTYFDRYDVANLALTKGCLGKTCVGQDIIPDDYPSGYATVRGINFYKRTFTILGDYSKEYESYTSSSLAYKKGCLQGICVGDKVLPDDYPRGYAIIKAINFTTKKFVVLGNYSTEYHRYSVEKISIIKECTNYNSSQRNSSLR